MHVRAATLTALMIVLPLAGCSSRQLRADGLGFNDGGVRDRAAFDFGCPLHKVEVIDLDGRDLSFGARGCGKRAAYVWKRSTVLLNSPIEREEVAPAE